MANEYKEIHFWEFPPTRTFVKLNSKFRKGFFDAIMKEISFGEAAKILNEKSSDYSVKRSYHNGHLSSWKKGFKIDYGKKQVVNIPLWVLIELSKELSKNNDHRNRLMLEIEKNIISYSGLGKSLIITRPILPILLTPEMVSILFHLCGDGHIGVDNSTSSYTQLSAEGLRNFKIKLENTFGKFEICRNQFKEGHLLIPRIITDFYMRFFKVNDCGWDIARIPDEIKNLPENFLLAGLTSFLIDEGHIGDTIEFYSGNYLLLNDVRVIAIELGYNCTPIKKKFRYGKFDLYRFYISLKSAEKLYHDINRLAKEFPTCGLAQKSKNLNYIIERRKRKWLYRENGATKNMIISLLKDEMTVKELAKSLNIGFSSTREHLYKLEKLGKIQKSGKIKQGFLWSIVK